MDTARVIVPPLVTAYAIFVVIVVRAWHGPSATSPTPPTARQILATVVGGYLVFLLIVAVFHVALAGQHHALLGAATGGAFLLIGASAVYAIVLWSVGRIGRVRSDREGGRADEGDGLENR
jgi:protein-S-isoprenylcysteine O-methyltransferase Ste14